MYVIIKYKKENTYDNLLVNQIFVCQGTEAVEGITFHSMEVGDLYLKSDSFRRMTNLRYLKIYNISNGSICNIHFPDGLEWLSDKLRYLQWDGYCLESLPSTFCAEMLVELFMSHSMLKNLWDGVQVQICLDILVNFMFNAIHKIEAELGACLYLCLTRFCFSFNQHSCMFIFVTESCESKSNFA